MVKDIGEKKQNLSKAEADITKCSQEINFLRDQIEKLKDVLKKYQNERISCLQLIYPKAKDEIDLFEILSEHLTRRVPTWGTLVPQTH